MADDDLLNRFISACEDAKGALERQQKAKYKGLGEAIRAARNHSVVKGNWDTLGLLVDLRNTIQHSRRFNGRPIATPRLDAVEAMESIAEQIDRPLKVYKFMAKDLQTVVANTLLPDAARLIIQHSLSQLPVVDKDGRYDWLLTTNALARWMGAKYEADEGALIEEGGTVAEVRRFAESHDVAETVSPNYQARKACNRLTAPEAPTALIITSDGKTSGSIQGILTRFDVPDMLKALSVRLRGH